MLYISRYFGFANYCVYDTDDGVETEVVPYAIKQAVCESGLEIGGVVKGSEQLEDILTYQDPEFTTREQTKLSMLLGVDIVTWGNIITGIRWRSEVMSEPVTVRLSDFGKVIGERVLYGNKEFQSHKLTLVVDDSLEISDMSFTANGFGRAYSIIGRYGMGVKFDLRELSDERKVQAVYNALVPRHGNKTLIPELSKDIIDHPSRRSAKIRCRLQGR